MGLLLDQTIIKNNHLVSGVKNFIIGYLCLIKNERSRREMMLKVFCKEDCGNAPKKQILKDFNIAYAKCDSESILEQVTDDVIWHMVGAKQSEGKEQCAEELERIGYEQATELHIEHIITHGNTASVNGVLTFHRDQHYAFCDVYVFNSFAKHA